MLDFGKVEYNPDFGYSQSIAMLESFNCDTGSSALLNFALYADSLGMGKVLYSFKVEPEAAEYIMKTNAIYKALHKAVCALAK